MTVKIVVIGASGFLGRAFVNRLAQISKIHIEPEKELSIGNVVLVDVSIDYFEKHPVVDKLLNCQLIKCNYGDSEEIQKVIEPSDGNEQVIVYLFAAVLSGNAESNFDLGMEVNLHAPLTLLRVMKETGMRLGHQLKLVYTSSDYVACFNDENRNRPFSEEGFRLSPTSYGVQKACVELLICDYARRGFVDGRVARISAMIGRPGFSNSISSAFSMIFTQTLIGNDYKVPLPMESILPCSSLENNVECLLMLGGKISGNDLGHNRVVQVPAASYSLREIWEATKEASKRNNIELGSLHQIDSKDASTTFTQLNVVPHVDSTRSIKLGLPQDISLASIINNFIGREITCKKL